LGAILGFRPHGSPLAALAGCGLIMGFSFAVKVNPVTQVSDAARGLLDLPLGRPLTTSLLWTAAILMVFAPLAVRAYRRQA
jgi:hypothetical protein